MPHFRNEVLRIFINHFCHFPCSVCAECPVTCTVTLSLYLQHSDYRLIARDASCFYWLEGRCSCPSQGALSSRKLVAGDWTMHEVGTSTVIVWFVSVVGLSARQLLWLFATACPLGHTHTHTHTLTHTHTHTHTHKHTLSLSHTHSHTHTHSLSLTHTLTHKLSLSLTHTHTNSLSLTHTHTLTHTHRHTNSLSLSLSHTQTHTHTHSHTDTHGTTPLNE